MDLDAGLQSQRGELRQQQISDHRIESCSKQALAAFVAPLFDVLFLTAVFRIQALALLHIMVAHRHAVATASADDKPLKQRWSFPWGTVAAILTMCLAIGAQLREMSFVVLPTDVASMHFLHEKEPLLLGKGVDVQRAIGMLGALGPSEAEGTGVARVTKHVEHGAVLQGHPMKLTGMGTAADPAWKEESLRAKILDRGPG
jgi:hypothetical protein